MDRHRARYDRLIPLLERAGQSHLLRFWGELSDAQRTVLLTDVEQIDLAACPALAEQYVCARPSIAIPNRIDPAPVYPSVPDESVRELYAIARRAGEAAIRAGRVCAFTVAGGQGTRLGFDGPKGTFAATPVRGASLFQVFAETLLGAERRFGRRPKWYVMTSPLNHDATIAYFAEQAYFGLGEDGVRFFAQGQMPAFLADGRIALSEKHRVALSPDGHGGSLAALARSGALEEMRRDGVDFISYFQVDNPLVRAIDPLFVGLHELTGSEMSSKAVTKAHDTERVGNFCLADGTLCVIEYSDLPESLATMKNPDGSRRFDAGSIAIHCLTRSFVERLTAEGGSLRLPWHRADKKIEHISDDGRLIRPDAPNGVKLETFVFDAIPLAKSPLVLMTPREEEFSPIKNADGADSPATSRRDQVRRAARWLESCGVDVPRSADGEPAATVEISPRFALDAEDLRVQLEARGKPTLRAGETLVLQ